MNRRQKKKKEKLSEAKMATRVSKAVKSEKPAGEKPEKEALRKEKEKEDKAKNARRETVIDFTGFASRSAFHEAMHGNSLFPDYAGNNLDAVFDMLTEISLPLTITIKDLDSWEAAAESYRGNIRKLFTRAGKENPNLSVCFE